MMNGTGAIEAGIGHLVKSMEGKGKIIIPVTMIIFSIGGATIGLAESTLIFIPIGIILARGLGYDALTGMAMVNIGAAVGFAGGALNPFTVGVAQGIAGLPIFSGLGFRVITQIVLLVISTWYVISYSSKVKIDPQKSLIYDIENKVKISNDKDGITQFTLKHKRVMAVLLVGFGFIIYGAIQGWSTSKDLASIFLIMGILSGIAGGSSSDKIANDFVDGAKTVTYGALVVGLSRGIVVVLQQGQIMDSFIHSASSILTMFPNYISAVFMLVIQTVINFFVNSGSGQAATTMPIMAPLADAVGVTRQTAVLAFQYGDGLSNSIFPTSGVLMAGLSIAQIPYEKWLKWVLPLMITLYITTCVFVIIGAAINLGPF